MTEGIPLTNDLLKNTMTDAMVYRGICQDLNTCLTPGYYQVQHPDTKNIPAGAYSYGILTVKKTVSFISQEYVPHAKGNAAKYKTCSRVWTEGIFSDWRSFTAD